MQLDDYSQVEQAALQKLIAYWIENWDWQTSPLFGRTRDDYQTVLNDWPQSFITHAKLTSGVIKSALNEFLNGSAPVPDRDFNNVIGLSPVDMKKLYQKLVPEHV